MKESVKAGYSRKDIIMVLSIYFYVFENEKRHSIAA